ncbi:MAG: hypothetical protein ACOZQL_37190 [Myxococcota bacterium]
MVRAMAVVVVLGGCQCLRAVDELPEPDSGNHETPDAGAFDAGPPRECISWRDAGVCDGGVRVHFDGVRCVPSCELDDPRLFERDVDCITTCACDHTKWRYHYDLVPETPCDLAWRVLTDGGGELIWDFTQSPQPQVGGGTPLGEVGVRKLCAISLQPEVLQLHCQTLGE